jgi:hypothetical protein
MHMAGGGGGRGVARASCAFPLGTPLVVDPFTLMRISILIRSHAVLDLDPDSDFFYLMRIRIRVSTMIRIRIRILA